jgi:hypothetical protein
LAVPIKLPQLLRWYKRRLALTEEISNVGVEMMHVANLVTRTKTDLIQQKIRLKQVEINLIKMAKSHVGVEANAKMVKPLRVPPLMSQT